MSQNAKENDNDCKNEGSSNFQSNDKDVEEEEDNIYNDEETKYYIQWGKKREDSIFLTKERMLKVMIKAKKPIDVETGDENLFTKIKRNVSKKKLLASSRSKSEDPKHMLEERLE